MLKRFIILVSIFSQLNAELLILKRVDGVFVPLTQEDNLKYQQKIFEIVAKYKWPTCLLDTSHITKAELDEFFAPNKSYGEERLVQKKLQEVILSSEIDLHVMFVPTTLYELFCLKNASKIKDKDLFLSTQFLNESDADKALRVLKIELKNRNNHFMKTDIDTENGFALINRLLSEYVVVRHPELFHQQNIVDVSNGIQEEAQHDTFAFLKVLGLKNFDTNIIAKSIDCEYQARKLNKALLYRATSFIDKIDQDGLRIKLLASTQRAAADKFYKVPAKYYSVSFGNSLFAGYFHDKGACVYHYLVKNAGLNFYTVFIDKQEHILSQEPLFFIPSINNLSSLYASGEIFHPRTRIAQLYKSDIEVEGLSVSNPIDPANILIYKGSPNRFEERFLHYLNDNCDVLRLQDNIELSQIKEYQKKYHDVMKKERLLMTKLLRRVYRLNLEKNPQISPMEIISKLLLLDEQELRSLNNLLMQEETKLDPLNLELFSWSDIELFNRIIIQKYNSWVKKNFTQDFDAYLIAEDQQQDVVDLLKKSLQQIVAHKVDSTKLFDDMVTISMCCYKLGDDLILFELLKFNASQLHDKQIQEIWKMLLNVMDNNSKIFPDLISELFAMKILTNNVKQQLLVWTEKEMRSNNTIRQDRALGIIKNLIEAKMITSNDMQQLLPLLAKGMASGRGDLIRYSLYLIQELAKEKILTVDNNKELWPMLEKAVAKGSEDLIGSTLSVIQELVKAQIVTVENKQQLLSWIGEGMASGDTSVQEIASTLLEELKSSFPPGANTSRQGLLHPTGLSLMGHDPYATISTDLMKRQGISREAVEQQEARVRAHVTEMGQDSGYQIPDLETQQHQFLEQQQMAQQGLERFSGEQAAHHVAPRIPYLIPRLAQQRRLAARQLLPKPADVARKGVRAIVR